MRKNKVIISNKKNRKFQLKPVYLLILLMILSIGLIVSSLRYPDRKGPLQQVVNVVVIPIQKALNKLGFDFQSDTSLSEEELQAENTLLQARIEELEQENFQYEKRQTELERLRKLYQLDENFEQYDMTVARVIGKTESNWFSTFLVDKGSRDGIQKNMNVICHDGLVGYVSKVNANYSKITTIIDETSGVSGEFLNSNVLCMVNGDMQQIQSGTLPVTNIDSEAEVQEGDTIVTSHISSKFLPGIKIGTSGKVTMDESSLSKITAVTPAVNFKNIHEVLIITTQKEEFESGE